ncbi:hypothetical protein [Haladaptatus salinisoli]|uniref:hypothetical protein n=1 Tax=Haladaptatus salinisoli TaxID=2884876 RepID=UPI001D0B49BA|nr:hypothetical protein [Haladaptatus salinisoli]
MHPRLRAALLVAMLLLADCIGFLSTGTASTTTDGRIPATTVTTRTTVEPTDAPAERIDGECSITVLDPNGNAVLSMGFSVGHAESSGDSS